MTWTDNKASIEHDKQYVWSRKEEGRTLDADTGGESAFTIGRRLGFKRLGTFQGGQLL